jgi:hypothetical protein
MVGRRRPRVAGWTGVITSVGFLVAFAIERLGA